MLANPCEQVRDSVSRGHTDVERIDGRLRRQRPVPHQLSREARRRVRQREDWDAAQRAQAARPLELVAHCSLVNHKLRDS